ncbi:hypothetical protein [Chromohalobacter sp. 48-RD10]|nr:hypothetical protein [Chromohalobacter sp. 48-RD10]
MEDKRNTARNLIARTELEDQMIAEITGLAIEEVSQLRSDPLV